MSLPRPAWIAPRRALVLYIGTIVVPGLVLVYLGIQGVWQQQTALESLTHTSERLSAERLVYETEQRALEQADRCLRDARLAGAIAAADKGNDPHTHREIRSILGAVVAQHPIASGILLFQDGQLRYPVLRTPLPRSEMSLAAGEAETERQAIVRLLTEAESVELRDGNVTRAGRIYERAFERAATRPVKALSLARRARCAARAGDCETADQLYRQLVGDFGDEYDPFGRPYALSGLQALSDGSPECAWETTEARNRLIPLLREVPTGRWELSADQVNHYIEDLRRRTGDLPGASTPYLEQFLVADAFSRVVARYGALAPGERHQESVAAGGTAHQVIYARVTDETQTDRQSVVALVVNLDWVRATLIPGVASTLGIRPPVVTPVSAQPATAGLGPLEASPVPFRALFTFWQLSPSPETVAEDRATIRRGAWVLGGSTMVVLALLFGGVLLLTRDVRREADVAKVKSNLVSGVSHELKTPLTVIRLYAETLSGDPQAAVEERLGYYDIITRESQRLTTLIDKVLDFSRIERGQKTYHLADGDLRRVVEETLASYESYLRHRGFSVEIDIRTPPPARFDADAVAEALVNLLDNAVKYSSESRWIGVRLSERGPDAALEVEDRGIGIADSDRQRIFGQFFRAGKQTGTGGYGLGLFLVKHIMDAHGGRIDVESEPGRGSLFRLVFPGSRVEDAGVEKEIAVSAGGAARA